VAFIIVGLVPTGGYPHSIRELRTRQDVDNVLDRVLQGLRDALISHLNWVCIFPGLPQLRPLHPHDTCVLWAVPQDMFSDSAIQLATCFAQWITGLHAAAAAPQRLTRSRGVSECSIGAVVAVGARWPPVRSPWERPDFHGPPHPTPQRPRHRAMIFR